MKRRIEHGNRLQIENILISLYWQCDDDRCGVQFCKRKYRIETELINSEQIFHSERFMFKNWPKAAKYKRIIYTIHTGTDTDFNEIVKDFVTFEREPRSVKMDMDKYAFFICNFFPSDENIINYRYEASQSKWLWAPPQPNEWWKITKFRTRGFRASDSVQCL